MNTIMFIKAKYLEHIRVNIIDIFLAGDTAHLPALCYKKQTKTNVSTVIN